MINRATFFSVFFRVFILREAQFTLSRDSKRTSRQTSCQSVWPSVTFSSRPCFSPRQHPRNWRLREFKTIRPWKMEKPVPLPVSRMRRRSLHARTHTGVSSGYPPPFKYLGYTYLRQRIQAESWCVRKRVPDSFYFLRTLFCASRAMRLVEASRSLATVHREGNFLLVFRGC